MNRWKILHNEFTVDKLCKYVKINACNIPPWLIDKFSLLYWFAYFLKSANPKSMHIKSMENLSVYHGGTLHGVLLV